MFDCYACSGTGHCACKGSGYIVRIEDDVDGTYDKIKVKCGCRLLGKIGICPVCGGSGTLEVSWFVIPRTVIHDWFKTLTGSTDNYVRSDRAASSRGGNIVWCPIINYVASHPEEVIHKTPEHKYIRPFELPDYMEGIFGGPKLSPDVIFYTENDLWIIEVAPNYPRALIAFSEATNGSEHFSDFWIEMNVSEDELIAVNQSLIKWDKFLREQDRFHYRPIHKFGAVWACLPQDAKRHHFELKETPPWKEISSEKLDFISKS